MVVFCLANQMVLYINRILDILYFLSTLSGSAMSTNYFVANLASGKNVWVSEDCVFS